jgi:hypothetical protein
MRVFQPTTRANANQCKSPTTVMRSALPRLPCVAGVAPFRRSSNRVSGGSSWLHPQLFSARWRFWGKITARTDGQTMMREQESGPSKQTIFPSFDSTRLEQRGTTDAALASASNIKPLSVCLCPDSKARDQKWKRHALCPAARQKVDKTHSSLQAPPLVLPSRPRFLSNPISVLSMHHRARPERTSSRLALRLHLHLHLHVNDRMLAGSSGRVREACRSTATICHVSSGGF